MTMAQRCVTVLRRYADAAAKSNDPMQSGCLKRAADLLAQQERELSLLRPLATAASDWRLARTDAGFRRRYGSKALARELEHAVKAVYEEMDGQTS